MAGDEVVGARELDKKFGKLASQLSSDAMLTSLFEGAKVLERKVKQNIRKQKLIDTSNYRQSITAEKLRDGAATHTPVIYGPIHEFGGTIRAKRAPFLIFKVNGQWFRVKSVRIPARPHWRPALASGQRDIIKGINASLIKSLVKIVGRGL